MKQMKMAFVVAYLVGCGSNAADGDAECSSDASCKGDRICVSGECVAPDEASSSSSSNSDSSDSTSSGLEGDANEPFGAACEDNSECDSDVCVFHTERGGVGFCSSWCDAVSECPTNYDCVTIGQAARKSCVPEDRLSQCKATCEQYSFFQCVDSSVAADCQLVCEGATVEERLRFSECAASELLGCMGTACLEALGVSTAAQSSRGCEVDYEVTAYCGGAPMRGLVCRDGAEPAESEGWCDLMGTEGNEGYFCCEQF